MASRSYNKEAEIIQAFNSTFRYVDDLINIDNSYNEGIVGRINPTELQLNKANASDIKPPFLDFLYLFQIDLFLSIIYYNRDDFDFDKVNFLF